ncbi:unnamed protein product [Didymodactylos carnosus]|uniref:Uncharacterized protein n=1 Tax=Didymodactylos carnosus TaxID=1234261 RepID=A0A8S2D3S6_9BILA|nr:unnamed protein product [Didymodactylos carnosus]CAF3655911.1 unnamed protein product [Didymodactylos carnosus]
MRVATIAEGNTDVDAVELPVEQHFQPTTVILSLQKPHVLHIDPASDVDVTRDGDVTTPAQSRENVPTINLTKLKAYFTKASFLAARELSSMSSVQQLIEELMEERKEMTPGDFDALKNSEWLKDEGEKAAPVPPGKQWNSLRPSGAQWNPMEPSETSGAGGSSTAPVVPDGSI